MGECFIQNFSQGYENIVCEGGLEISVPLPFLPILWRPSPYFVTPFPHLLSSVLCK